VLPVKGQPGTERILEPKQGLERIVYRGPDGLIARTVERPWCAEQDVALRLWPRLRNQLLAPAWVDKPTLIITISLEPRDYQAVDHKALARELDRLIVADGFPGAKWEDYAFSIIQAR
jgi:hypothetical protein